MKHSGSTSRFGQVAWVAVAALALNACSGGADDADADAEADTPPAATANAGAAAGAAAKPAADNTDTLSGAQFASFTGNAAAGKTAFITCQTCHAVEAGVNKIGPSLAGIVGRKAGTIPGFTYTPANRDSGITWTEAKLFQYLENPQRVVPGTKMAFAGFPEPQKRADVIAYLKNPT